MSATSDELNDVLGLIDAAQARLQRMMTVTPQPATLVLTDAQRSGATAAYSYLQDGRDTVASILKSL